MTVTSPEPDVEARQVRRRNLVNSTWVRLQSLFVPSVSLVSVLVARAADDQQQRNDIVLQLFAWERERLLTSAKGIGAAAAGVLAALIADAVKGDAHGSPVVQYFAGALVALLLMWAGFVLTGLRRLQEQYAIALQVVA